MELKMLFRPVSAGTLRSGVGVGRVGAEQHLDSSVMEMSTTRTQLGV
jgi:hypothetical protein